MRHWRQKSERVEIGLQVSPMAKGVKYALTLAIGGFEYTGGGRFTCRFGSGHHMSTTRITDATGCVLDSPQRKQRGLDFRRPSLPAQPSWFWAAPSLAGHSAGLSSRKQPESRDRY